MHMGNRHGQAGRGGSVVEDRLGLAGQQRNTTTTSYQLELVVESTVPTTPSSWGAIKRLYE